MICQLPDGSLPFSDWLDSLDKTTYTRIEARVDRLERGNFGDVQPIGNGVSELRLDFGPGYRIYFAQRGLQIHLINGGTKRTQATDIPAALEFWRNHD